VKLDADTLPTAPDAPPEAGPDRALDPPLPDPCPSANPLLAAGWAGAGGGADHPVSTACERDGRGAGNDGPGEFAGKTLAGLLWSMP